ncbi:SURF1 family protein [Nesterenkonia alkaliphila]|uniref:SURF1-like protein n=1 Tax=Nesterenkonia alkaliphila TaxID=1463631 RepID=A0A7K1UEF1_9MICC|nr:SURF1 family protein [Nesterenkonia alkaliphila]GFZ93448.1 SURF1-like protein [Nesterenkonia alkaliphila]
MVPHPPSFWDIARQPKWIAMLILALVMATVFVVLSAWQFGASRSETVQHQDTETPAPLTEIYEPARPITVHEADRIVDVTGEFLPETQVFIAERLQEGESGYWAVAAFQVADAPAGEVIPVVRGWAEDYDAVGPPPEGQLTLQGRLLPTEAPAPGPRELPYPLLSTLSVAELINLWDEDSYSGFLVDFSGEAGASGSSSLEGVWVGTQPEGSSINWLNLFYAVEWVVFAGFAFYFWWRMVRDAQQRQAEEARLDAEWEEQWRREQLAKQQAAQAEENE